MLNARLAKRHFPGKRPIRSVAPIRVPGKSAAFTPARPSFLGENAKFRLRTVVFPPKRHFCKMQTGFVGQQSTVKSGVREESPDTTRDSALIRRRSPKKHLSPGSLRTIRRFRLGPMYWPPRRLTGNCRRLLGDGNWLAAGEQFGQNAQDGGSSPPRPSPPHTPRRPDR